MKNWCFSAILLSLLLLSATAATAQRRTDSRLRKGWREVWKEEFRGRDIDHSSWRRCEAGGADWMRHMSPLDSLCRIKNGVLELWGISTPEGYDDDRPFLTGGIYSEGLRSVKNGRVEVRARFDCAQGFWPAIWLMPDVKTPWPVGGEIDIMEHLNYDDIAYQTVHSSHTYHQRSPKSKNSHTTPIDKSRFNIYSVEVSDSAITFYINNEKTFSYDRMKPTPDGQFPFADHPFYVILSAQLGGSWVGKVDPADLPVKMEIDYVRFYERK